MNDWSYASIKSVHDFLDEYVIANTFTILEETSKAFEKRIIMTTTPRRCMTKRTLIE